MSRVRSIEIGGKVFRKYIGNRQRLNQEYERGEQHTDSLRPSNQEDFYEKKKSENQKQCKSPCLYPQIEVRNKCILLIECEGWRRHSSLIFLILLLTKPNIEVSGWLYQTKTHFTHIVYQPFSRVSPLSFTIYG